MGRHGGGEVTGPSSQLAGEGRGGQGRKGSVSGRSPYAGTYKPARLGMTKRQLVEGLKGIKIKHPNRHLTSTAYKTGLKKTSPEESEG